MKVDAFYGKVPNDKILAEADAVITPLKKNEKPFLPSFVQSTVAPDYHGGDRAALTPDQHRRAMRYYQAWSRVAGLVAFTTVKDIYIEHGKLIGTFLLKRMYNHGINVKFYGFDPVTWPSIMNQDMKHEVTVHIFYGKAKSGQYTPDSSAVQVECFRPDALFMLPSYLEAILKDLSLETPLMSNEYKKRVCSLFYFITLMQVAKQVGCQSIVLLETAAFKDDGMEIFKSEFPGIQLKGYPMTQPVNGTEALQIADKKEIQKTEKPPMIIGENDFVNKPSSRPHQTNQPIAEAPARPADPAKLAELANKFGHEAAVTA